MSTLGMIDTTREKVSNSNKTTTRVMCAGGLRLLPVQAVLDTRAHSSPRARRRDGPAAAHLLTFPARLYYSMYTMYFSILRY